MKHYWVVSPEMSVTCPILEDGTGPEEVYCCATSVKANNKREAKILALKTMEMLDWVSYQREDGKNPFAGLEVKDAMCPHGKCACFYCNDECEICIEEAITSGATEAQT